MTISERVRYLRKNVLHLNQTAFGAEIHLKQTAVSWMEDQHYHVTERNISAICHRWNVREEWLRTGEGDIFVQNNSLDEQRIAFAKAYASLDRTGRDIFFELIQQPLN